MILLIGTSVVRPIVNSVIGGNPPVNGGPPPPVTFTYRRPGGVDTFRRPDAISIYIRP